MGDRCLYAGGIQRKTERVHGKDHLIDAKTGFSQRTGEKDPITETDHPCNDTGSCQNQGSFY